MTMGAMIDIATLAGDGRFGAYRAEPADAPKAAIVVVQEIFGVNAGIRAKCDRLAGEGYLAIAPDLFWRSEPGVVLDADVPADFQKGIDLMMRCDVDLAIADIAATIRAARVGTGGGKVGVVGYCFGGRIAYLAATRTDADASVGYYGAGIDHVLGEAHAIGKPLLLHFAERDHFIDSDARAKIHAALDGNAHVEIADYAGVDHGFAAEFGARRDEPAAAAADARSATFFKAHLA